MNLTRIIHKKYYSQVNLLMIEKNDDSIFLLSRSDG
jgi:hypothetical protein